MAGTLADALKKAGLTSSEPAAKKSQEKKKPDNQTQSQHQNQNQNQKKFIELKPTSQGIKLSWKNITLELDPDFDEKTLLRFLSVLR